MNVGPLVGTFVLAYGILFIIVFTDIRLILFLPFYCSYDLHFAFRLRIRIFKLMTSHEHRSNVRTRADEHGRNLVELGHLTRGWRYIATGRLRI